MIGRMHRCLAVLAAFACACQCANIPPTSPISMLIDPKLFSRTGSTNDIYRPTCCPEASSPAPSATVAASSISASSPGCPINQASLSGSYGNGHWGYWYDGLAPAMVVSSGAEFEVKMPTFTAGSAWTEMGAGDADLESIYAWDQNGPRINMRGPTGNSGGHFLTGPVYVCGAEPGDILQVDILDLVPRPNPGYNNRSFGVTFNSGIGWFGREGGAGGYITPGYASNRSVVVIYEAIKDIATGQSLYWEPSYAYDGNNPAVLNAQPGCVPTNGSVPNTTTGGAAMWYNPSYTFGGKSIACTASGQSFTYPYGGYAGQVLTVPESIRDYSIKGMWRVPINMHIGNMGLAPRVGAPVVTHPPMRTGGNIDDKRIGIGASMYYPGSPCTRGTAFQISYVQSTTHFLENANEFVIHGYAFSDWIREIGNPQVNVSKPAPYGGTELTRAMSVAYNETREFMMNAFFSNYTLSEDLAINAMSNIVDFGITQIVDSNVGVHSIIPKWPFNASAWETTPYYQATNKCGTSRSSYP